MDTQVKGIIRLFHKEEPVCWEIREIRLEDEDSRWVVFVDFSEDRFVIKIASNDFTWPERIEGWEDIVEAYRDLGYYSPAILKGLNGCYAQKAVFCGKECIVWEEEYAKYPHRDSLDKCLYMDESGNYAYYEEVLAFLGKVARKHYDFFPYASGWARFEPFGLNEETDEVMECVRTFDALVREKAPRYLSRWERIYDLFQENARQLQEIYHELPTSVFQSDHFGDNLLLDKEGHFKGVIDYNLAGRDTFINVVLYTVLFGYHGTGPVVEAPDILPEYNPAAQDRVIQDILDAFRRLRRYYAFNEAEAKAALPLYKYISCIEYRQIEAFKKYAEDDGKLNLLFDAMEYELMREEDGFFEAMVTP